jgi:hypothetical protein
MKSQQLAKNIKGFKHAFLLACLLAFFFVWPELAKSFSYG